VGAGLLLSRIGDLTVDGGVEGTTETSTFSGATGAGNPGTNKLFIVRGIADIRNDSGAIQTVRHRWKYGPVPTVLEDFTTISLADAGATDRYADITNLFLGGENSVTAQRTMMEHRQSGAIAFPPGQYAGGNDQNTGVNSTAVDSSVSQTLQHTAQLSAANAELEYRERGIWVELLSSGLDSGTTGSRLVLFDGTEFIYSNSVTVTTVATLPIPGGTISTGNLLIAKIYMDALNTSGATCQWWTDVFYGGTQIFDGVSGVANASNAAARAFPLEIWIGGHGATNDQVCAMIGQGIGGEPGSGAGAVPQAGGQANNSVSECAVDSTADQDLVIKTTMSVAHANNSIRYRGASVKVIKA
jgi:hypothetical protein